MESTDSAWWSWRWVWWSAFSLAVVGGLGTLASGVRGGTAAIAYVVASAVWLPLGLLVWRRRPMHPIGPLLFLVGILNLMVIPGFMMGALLEQFEAIITPRPWPVVIFTAAAGAYSYAFLIPILLFPDGKPSGRAQTLILAAILIAGLVATASGVLAQPLHSVPHPFSPPWMASSARSIYDAMTQAYGFGLVAVVVIKISEFRRSELVRKTQLKWLIYVLAVYMLATAVSFGIVGVEDFGAGGLWVDATFVALIPAAMAVAVLRYRLYEIDRLISRTVTYALVVLVISVAFALPAILASSALGKSQDLVVALATLGAAAVFAPLRRRLQRRVDRRFNRTRYDADIEIQALATRLGAGPETGLPVEEARDLVRRALQPTTISIWVRDGGVA